MLEFEVVPESEETIDGWIPDDKAFDLLISLAFQRSSGWSWKKRAERKSRYEDNVHEIQKPFPNLNLLIVHRFLMQIKNEMVLKEKLMKENTDKIIT